MKRRIAVWWLWLPGPFLAPPFLALPFLAGQALGQPSATDKQAQLRDSGTRFLERLVKAEFAKAAESFDATMKEKLPVDKLKEMWQGLEEKLGPLEKQGPARHTTAGKYEAVLILCKFKKMALDARIVFADDGRITGLFFVPAGTGEYKPPAYVQADSFAEREVKVGGGDWILPGTITMPRGSGPFPGVVLVHGSGPNDRDETILANKPFRDLAWGLATNGIAALRYEKRTREHGAKLSKEDLTVREEVLDDALAAAALLRKTEKVDAKRVFILGHSLGAMMAPRLATLDGDLAGIILMASPSRPLEDLVVEQFTYIYSLQGEPSEKQKEDLERLRQQAARLKDANLPADTPSSDLPLGMPLRYWRSLQENHPVNFAGKVMQRMLILHGERDYQVTMDDFEGWKKATKDRANVMLKSYPRLNHLFMEGEGKGRPEEYQRPGNVAPYVIVDLVNWVKQR